MSKDKQLVSLHTTKPVLTKAEFDRLLQKAKIYKAIGKIAIFLLIITTMAMVNNYLG